MFGSLCLGGCRVEDIGVCAMCGACVGVLYCCSYVGGWRVEGGGVCSVWVVNGPPARLSVGLSVSRCRVERSGACNLCVV